MATRAVAVRGVTQGSGHLLGRRLVLTADHVVRAEVGGAAEAAVPGGTGWGRCTVLWRSQELDAVLLLAGADLVQGEVAPVRWGRTDRHEPLGGCHLTGFPAVERDDRGRLESTQVTGSLMPESGLLKGSEVFLAQQLPPVAAQGSPWAGLSGAAVVFRGRVLALVLRDHNPGAWGSSQLDVLPAAALLAAPGFAFSLVDQLGAQPRLEGISEQEIADTDFEREYAESIQADYGRIRIFGLGKAHGQGRRGWGLDAGYLTLEATELSDRSRRHPAGAVESGEGEGRSGPQQVPEMLRGKRRILLRGQAGSGKTTLVQWLATGAVAGTLDEELAELNGRVPLVLQLRKLARQGNFSPRPEELLALDGRLCADAQPAGWAARVLASGRAMLLVDGLDEVPDAQRRETLRWLERLLDHYPEVWTMATVRPSAVEPGWLAHLDFEELALRPMGEEHRRRFIGRWHGAILAELTSVPHTPLERARWQQELDELESGLLRTLEQSDDLAQITDSPLLCAMVCALNRESDGALPSHRMEIYRDALSMLLVKRDDAKQVGADEKLRPSEPEQLALLRRIAHWLVRNNQVEGERTTAIRQIDAALASLPALARQGDAAQVYAHLLNRSGLLAETSTDTFQFIHRTFQDYLAALEFREQADFGLLTRMAAEQTWQDVIRMTVGHSGPRERAELLGRLVAAGDEAEGERQLAVRLAAGTCLPYAQELDGASREAVLSRLSRQLTDDPAALDSASWAPVGEGLIGVLRMLLLDGVELDQDEVVRTAGQLGGDEALALLGELAADGVSAETITREWSNFGHTEFVAAVISRIDLSTFHILLVTTAEQLAVAAGLGASGIYVDAEGIDLAPLADWPELTELYISEWGYDLSVLAGTAVRVLDVYGAMGLSAAAWRALNGITALRISANALASVPPGFSLPNVEFLGLFARERYRVDVSAFPGLRHLLLYCAATETVDLRAAAAQGDFTVEIRTEGGDPPELLGREAFEPDRLTMR
ncbi:NACHT domain-containing protein [Kitasatospora sp. NPDC002040]|uniref:NACHT domain-containing protein n=1 Tax=Kitasatospora sp. NPDC002040 TaxID=3154661 RepID=UPI00332D0F75